MKPLNQICNFDLKPNINCIQKSTKYMSLYYIGSDKKYFSLNDYYVYSLMEYNYHNITVRMKAEKIRSLISLCRNNKYTHVTLRILTLITIRRNDKNKIINKL